MVKQLPHLTRRNYLFRHCQQSTPGGCSARTATKLPRQRWQTLRCWLHHNLSSKRRRSNGAQAGEPQNNPFRKPILQGWRDSNGLWRLSREEQTNQAPIKCGRHERVANVYTLPSIPQTIKYHHASAGFPTKDSWVKQSTQDITYPGQV